MKTLRRIGAWTATMWLSIRIVATVTALLALAVLDLSVSTIAGAWRPRR